MDAAAWDRLANASREHGSRYAGLRAVLREEAAVSRRSSQYLGFLTVFLAVLGPVITFPLLPLSGSLASDHPWTSAVLFTGWASAWMAERHVWSMWSLAKAHLQESGGTGS